MKQQVHYIVVHREALHPEKAIESIKEYWMKERHLKHPGYHYIIGRSGAIETLSLEQTVLFGKNGIRKNSIHISHTGGVDSENNLINNRTASQIEMTIKKLTEFEKIYPRAMILGQYDIMEFLKAA